MMQANRPPCAGRRRRFLWRNASKGGKRMAGMAGRRAVAATVGRAGALALALAAILTFMIDAADARVGRGGSFGSRGTRTYTAPPSTQTAPTTAKPIERS